MKIIVNILCCMFALSFIASSAWGQMKADSDFWHSDSLSNDTLFAKQKNGVNNKKKRKHGKCHRFFKNFNQIDTTYVTPNYYNFTAMLQQTCLVNAYSISGKNASGDKQKINFYSKPRLTLGPYLGWHWFFLGYNFDIVRAYKSNKSTQFNFSVYSSTFGADIIYQKNNGDFTIDNIEGFGKQNDKRVKDVEFDGLKTSIRSVNVYYIFNHKRFSYPAAYSQSTVQRKSCGTWKLGFIYSHQTLDFDHNRFTSSIIPENENSIGIYDELKFDKINYYDYSINFGYAYNWVFAPNFLCSVSLAPAVGYKFAKGESFESQDLLFKRHNLNFDAIGRFGFVWNTNRLFAGTSAIVHAYNYNKSKFSISNAVAVFNVYCGINFVPKGHYRRSNPARFKKW